MVHLIAVRSEDSLQQSIVLFVGPTGIGKSALAMHLARCLGGEIVNADSVQLYRRLNIGSAKATIEEQKLVRHHVLDVLEPDAQADAQLYCDLADPVIKDLTNRSVLPFIVGGTGLYTRALVRGLAQGIPSDLTLRTALNTRAQIGLQELAQMHRELRLIDPVYADKIAASDPIRIIRALEVWQLTGVPLSQHHALHAAMPPRYRALWIGLELDRASLRKRIELRTVAMFEAGWYDEVRELVRDFSAHIKSLQSVGYAEVVRAVVAEKRVEQSLIDEVVQSSMAFAKRQRTWFRGEAGVQWMSYESAITPELALKIQRWCANQAD